MASGAVLSGPSISRCYSSAGIRSGWQTEGRHPARAVPLPAGLVAANLSASLHSLPQAHTSLFWNIMVAHHRTSGVQGATFQQGPVVKEPIRV
jgi:hypothetical protein